MPVITRFYGIIIKMYFREHGVPHFHAIYGEYNGVFEIATLKMIKGDLPKRSQKMIREWAAGIRMILLKCGTLKSFGTFRG